jgi:hypothetical protein
MDGISPLIPYAKCTNMNLPRTNTKKQCEEIRWRQHVDEISDATDVLCPKGRPALPGGSPRRRSGPSLLLTQLLLCRLAEGHHGAHVRAALQVH